MTPSKSSGFTLMEVLVAVVIVGILATIAIPSYQNYILRNNRATVKRVMTDLVTKQEAQFLRARQYAASLQTLVSSNSASATELWVEPSGTLRSTTSADSRYKITLICAANAAGTNTCVSFSLQADAINAQTRDNSCARLTLTSIGGRTATSADCWDR